MTTCNCSIQTKNSSLDTDNIHFNEIKLIDTFYISLSNSNFRVTKCYELLFSIEGQLNNIGSMIFIIIILIILILMICCFAFEMKKIIYFIEIVLKIAFRKEYIKNNIKEKGVKPIKQSTIAEKKSKNKGKTLILSKNKREEKIIHPKLNDKKKIKKNNKPKTNYIKNKVKKEPPRKVLPLSSQKNRIKTKEEKILSSKQHLKNDNSNFNLSSSLKHKKDIYKKSKINDLKNNDNKKKSKKDKIYGDKIINEYELNHLDYVDAINNDKRSFFQTYFSITKHNILIIFAIIPINDFNLRTIKLSLFLMSFSVYFTINCFFFSDDSMHKIYIECGKYNFESQIL